MERIYITNLGKYNEGQLIGEWLELPYTDDELSNLLTEIHIGSDYEEYFIADYEGELLQALDVDEYTNISVLNDIIDEWSNMDDYQQEIILALIEIQGYGLREWDVIISQLDECYIIDNIASYSDLGYYLVNECRPDIINDECILFQYIDYDKFGRDCSFDGYYLLDNGTALSIPL